MNNQDNIQNFLFLIIGIAMAIISIVQWMFLFPDPSQLMLGIFLGGVVFAIGFLFEHSYNTSEKLESIEHRLDSLVYAKKSEQELQAVKRGRK